MGRPRLIILIRHAQSEGNRNRSIHQTVPDHRVKLTPDGWAQAEDAGRRLRTLLRPDDTLQFFTSPYQRTRETTDGILRTLTSDEETPTPFPRHTIKVWEEPRLREQDFGNFQPCSAAMERMWQERADYGHFFYRIPHGESAADAYDRISGFNESLWRSFEEEDFPSVCVLVTHGLMSRVFLMKWYHWSVEYFEDLRNVGHCEFVIMKRSEDTRKYVLQNELRTWSELKRKATEERRARGEHGAEDGTAPVPKKRWGGCPDGCTHGQDEYPKRPKRQDTIVAKPAEKKPYSVEVAESEQGNDQLPRKQRIEEDEEAFPHERGTSDSNAHMRSGSSLTSQDLPAGLRAEASSPLKPPPQWLRVGRDGGGSESGMATPAAVGTDAAAYGFPEVRANSLTRDNTVRKTDDRHHSRTPSAREADWVVQSGMGTGARADRLGDEVDSDVGSEASGAEGVDRKERVDKSLRGSVY